MSNIFLKDSANDNSPNMAKISQKMKNMFLKNLPISIADLFFQYQIVYVKQISISVMIIT